MEITQFYQASFFCDLADITPKPELIIDLTKNLKEFGLIPSSASELVIGDRGVISTKPRILLTSQRKDFTIRFGENRFLIEQNNYNNEIMSVDDFVLKVKGVFGILYPIFERKGKRLSFVTSIQLDEKNDKILEENYKKILVPQSIYKKKTPYEWNTRQVTTEDFRIKDNIEKVNIITELSRAQGMLSEKIPNKKANRLILSTDINTHQGNISPRFDSEDFEKFLQQAIAQFKSLKTEYGELLK